MMSTTPSSNSNGHDNDKGREHWPRWSGIGLTAFIAILAFTVQWGVVNTKLDHVERRLDELIFESRSLRDEYQSIERRLSFLEGRGSHGQEKRQ